MIIFVLKIRQWLWLLLIKSDFERFKSFSSDDPRTDSSLEILGIEGSERNVFPYL